MKISRGRNMRGILIVFCVFMLLIIPGVLQAATYYTDTDGDGYTETITTTSSGISIYHPKTNTTRSYTYSASYGYFTNFNIYAITDTDGQPGNEIIVTWQTCSQSLGCSSSGISSQGIDVIVDRTSSKHTYNYTPSYGYFTNYYIKAITDTDGLLGNEIIVTWQTCSQTLGCSSSGISSQGIDVIVDRTSSKHTYNYYNFGAITNYSVAGIADTDGQPGNEIIVKWQECSLTLGCSSSGIIDQGLNVIHDSTQQTKSYARGLSATVQSIHDYDKVAGSEICYYTSPNVTYDLIVDRTQTTQSRSNCNDSDSRQAPTISIAPPSGSSYAGTPQNFTVVYSDANGTSDIWHPYIALRVDATSWSNAIVVYYDRPTNTLWLTNDAGTGYVGSCTVGAQTTISNSQGTMNCGQTTVTSNGNDMTINWNITPNASFGGTKNIYLYVTDMENLNSGLVQKSNWRINAPPFIKVAPPSGSSNAGNPQNFTVVYSDSNGASDLWHPYIGISTSIPPQSNGIIAYYDRPTNTLWLTNDAGSGYVGSCTVGAQTTISNSQGTINCGQTTVTTSGNDMTINWNITPLASFRGTKNIYLYVTDMENLNSGLITNSTWTIN